VRPEAASPALPRSVRIFGIPAVGLLLVGLFIYLGFPYAKLGDRIATEVQRRHGVRVDFESVRPRLRLAGPGIQASGVRATFPGGEALRIERVALRPAWSMAWLRGDRAVYTEVESDLGNLTGTIVLGGSNGFSGDLEQVAVGRLPLARAFPLGSLDGVLDAAVDILVGEQGPEGRASFEARDGSLDIKGLPMAIPFETLSGELDFGGETLIAVNRLDLAGPMASANVTGSVLQAASFEEAPLRLEAQIEAKADLQPAMREAGVRFDRNGKAKVRVTGTVALPNIR
jgi:type II secretion system protein N